MIAEELLELQEARPFVPFEVHLADGSRITIQQWKWMLVAPNLRVLHYVNAEGPSHKVAIGQITQIVQKPVAEATSETVRN